MSASGKTNRKNSSRSRKPPPRWRKYLVQAELELPPPATSSTTSGSAAEDDCREALVDPPELQWWQTRPVVLGLVAACIGLLAVAGVTFRSATQDREAAVAAEARARMLTLRAVNSVRTLRIAPNPGSWSASADASIDWPEPPELLELRFPVGYTRFPTFALVVDKVDHGRVMIVERMTPDSNRELRLAVNSTAFGPGEYRIRVQGYTWRGERIDVGWVRLVVE